MKTTWRVIDKDGKVIFTGPHGWFNEAKEYINKHPEKAIENGLELDPDMN